MQSAAKKKKDQEIAYAEQLDAGIVKITLKQDIDPNRCIEELYQFFDQTFENGAKQILLDMEQFQFPNASFISFLIGKTAEARRFGHEIRLINISETARNHLAMFSALTYLSIGAEEKDDFEEFKETSSPSPDELIRFDDGVPCLLQVEAAIDALNKVTDFVIKLADHVKMDPTESSKLKIAVYEACMNVIEHGYQFEPDELISVEVQHIGERLYISIIDTGRYFDFYDQESYNVKEAMDDRRRGGYGLHIIQRSVDEIHYLNTDEGNRLTLIKNIIKLSK